MLTPLRGLQQGVTLIELVVGIAMIGTLFALGLPNFRTWLQNAQIRTATDAVQNGLQLARAEAVRRNALVQFALNGSNSSWTVGCVTAVADLDGDGVADCPATIQTRSSAEGSSGATVAAGQNTFVFNSLGRVTPTPAANINICIGIAAASASSCADSTGAERRLQIVVSPSGQVRMCDPALPSSDAQGC